jgi:hypothetical protein
MSVYPDPRAGKQASACGSASARSRRSFADALIRNHRSAAQNGWWSLPSATPTILLVQGPDEAELSKRKGWPRV